MEKSTAQRSRELFFTYFSAMLFAFTGGNITWPLVQEKLADQYRLISREKSLEYFALGQSLPGILSLNAAILIGRDVAGWQGAFAAAAGNIVPAFFGMLVIALSYTSLSSLPFLRQAIGGIRAASVAIISVNALSIAGRARRKSEYFLVIFAVTVTLVLRWNILLVILLCGAAGVMGVWVQKRNGAGPKGTTPGEGDKEVLEETVGNVSEEARGHALEETAEDETDEGGEALGEGAGRMDGTATGKTQGLKKEVG